MPNNWKTYKLSEVANLVTGYAFKSKFYEDDGDLRVIRGKNITEGYLRWGGDSRFWNHSLEKLERYSVQEDDIVIGMDGSKIGKNRAIVRKHDLPAILAQRVAMVRAKEDRADQKYIWQLINNGPFENYVENVKTGTSIPHISLGQVGNFEIVLPPLPEQQAIASILSSLDDKIELNLKMNKTLEEMAMTLYKHWFVDFGPFKSPLEGGAWKAGDVETKSEHLPVFGSGKFIDSELGLIPEGWEVKGILEIVDLLSGGTPKTTMDEYWNGDICWVSAKDIGNGGLYINDTEKKITELGVSKSATKILPEDTVILVARGSVGKYGMIAKKMAMNQSCYGLSAKGEYSQGLVYLMFSELIEQFKRMAYGSVFDTITTSTFKSTNVIVPPTSIIENLKTQIDPLFDQLKQNVLENESLIALRNTLLPKLISGEVRVKEAAQSLASMI